VKKAIQGGAFTFQTLFKGIRGDTPACNVYYSYSLQTYDCELKTTTFYLSLLEWAPMSIKDREMQQGTQAPNLRLPIENTGSNDISAGMVHVI
jgi:hypothetical protein